MQRERAGDAVDSNEGSVWSDGECTADSWKGWRHFWNGCVLVNICSLHFHELGILKSQIWHLWMTFRQKQFRHQNKYRCLLKSILPTASNVVYCIFTVWLTENIMPVACLLLLTETDLIFASTLDQHKDNNIATQRLRCTVQNESSHLVSLLWEERMNGQVDSLNMASVSILCITCVTLFSLCCIEAFCFSLVMCWTVQGQAHSWAFVLFLNFLPYKCFSKAAFVYSYLQTQMHEALKLCLIIYFSNKLLNLELTSIWYCCRLTSKLMLASVEVT